LAVADSIKRRRPTPPWNNVLQEGGRAGDLTDSRTEAERGYLAMTLEPADEETVPNHRRSTLWNRQLDEGDNAWAAAIGSPHGARGMSPDGTKSVTILLFTEGKVFVTLEFDGAPDDPVPPEGVTDVGHNKTPLSRTGDRADTEGHRR
jgi:hypothetical protein